MANQLLAILSEPEIAESDCLGIEGLRSRYDPHHSLVGAHFTLVFPVSVPALAEVLAHAQGVAAGAGAIAFHLSASRVAKDAASASSHVFLVPDEGFAAIVELHDRLYSGPLTGALRLDIPFVPHVTVASFEDAQSAKSLADKLNEEGVSISGMLSAVDVVVLQDDKAVTRLARFCFR